MAKWNIDDPARWTWAYSGDKKEILISPPEGLPEAQYYGSPLSDDHGYLALHCDDVEDDGPEKLADYICEALNGNPAEHAVSLARSVLREAQEHLGAVAARLGPTT